MQIVSFLRPSAAVVIITFFVTASGVYHATASEKPATIVVRCNADDGLSLRLRDALVNAFSSSADFKLDNGKEVEPNALIVTIPSNVGWKRVAGREQVLYTVTFATADGSYMGTTEGSCWADALASCSAKIVKRASEIAAREHK